MYDSAENKCIQQSASGCSNPFPYSSYLGCTLKNTFPKPVTSFGTTKTIPAVQANKTDYEDEVRVNEVKMNYFPDTDSNSLEGKAAAYLRDKGVIGGRPDGTFDGTASVNRAELAKFLLLANGVNVGDLKNNGKFPDVLEGEWYVKYVIKAAEKGIISGYPDGIFRPAKTVNTAEFLKMLVESFHLPKDLFYDYVDVSNTDWYGKYAGVAYKYNLFPNRRYNKLSKGFSGEAVSPAPLLKPEQELTRSEVAVAIWKVLTENTTSSPGYSTQPTSTTAPSN